MTRDVDKFLLDAGWSNARITNLAGDASNRRYDRLIAKDGQSAVLMDAPPEKGEDVRPFVRIARYLKELGLSAPEILYQDASAGFLLLEDLGDNLFARDMARDPSIQLPLYKAASDVLTVLHRAVPPALAVYSSETTVPLSALAYDWYLFGATGSEDPDAKARFSDAFSAIIAGLDCDLSVLIQRDYHAENLLWLPERQGPARVGLLDFQDAMRGHPAYDLVSVLQDARRDVPCGIERDVKSAFVQENNHNSEAFDAAYAIFGFQRNMRILGVFSRLCMRNCKAHYVDFLPRVWRHIQTNLKHLSLRELSTIIDGDFPAPTAEIRDTLKGKCGQWAGR